MLLYSGEYDIIFADGKLKMMNGSKDVYYSLTPDTSIIRPRTHSQVTPGRRQRKISQVNRKFSHTSIPRKRRESRHAMQSAASALSRDQHLDAVKELETTKDQGGYFDKVGFVKKGYSDL